MRYSMVAYSYGKVVGTLETDDYKTAQKFYRWHVSVRTYKNGERMTYPQSDRLFKTYTTSKNGFERREVQP